MQLVITAYDSEGMLDKRMEVRPLHLQGMERLKEHLIVANRQPWHFVAVTNKEKLAELAGRRGMIKQAVIKGNYSHIYRFG